MSYWAAWRATHPEYRQREAERSRRRRTAWGRGDRTADYARQRERRAAQRVVRDGDNGVTTTDHPLLALARSIVARIVRPDRRATLHRPTYEDAVSEAAAALVAGEDAEQAARRYVNAERAWEHRTAPMLVDPKSVDPDYEEAALPQAKAVAYTNVTLDDWVMAEEEA
jgi:hypothetical protein